MRLPMEGVNIFTDSVGEKFCKSVGVIYVVIAGSASVETTSNTTDSDSDQHDCFFFFWKIRKIRTISLILEFKQLYSWNPYGRTKWTHFQVTSFSPFSFNLNSIFWWWATSNGLLQSTEATTTTTTWDICIIWIKVLNGKFNCMI